MSFKNSFEIGESKGSFMVAGALFMAIFLSFGTFSVDLSRYYLSLQKVQTVADNAALAGANALQQYRDEPDVSRVYDAVIGHVESSLGEDYTVAYRVHSDTDVEGIIVKKFDVADTGAYADEYHRVGVLVYGTFYPYFWPRSFFGERETSVFVRWAVAEARPRVVREVIKKPVECGIYSGGSISLSGNNFDASEAEFCGSSGIDASGSSDGVMGNVHLPNGASFNAPGGGAGSVYNYEGDRSPPGFTPPPPSNFDVNLEDFSDWTDEGNCSGGGKAMRTSDTGGEDLVWENDGSKVCVESTASGYQVSNNNGGQIQKPGGEAASIYSDQSFTFDGNGNGLDGALYVQGNLTVDGNDYLFDSDPDKIGGLALWASQDVAAEGDVDFDKNNVQIRGLTGSGGEYRFGSPGGGTGPKLEGALISNGSFYLPSNSDAAEITYNPDLFSYKYLDTSDWEVGIQEIQQRPLYSKIKVNLVS